MQLNDTSYTKTGKFLRFLLTIALTVPVCSCTDDWMTEDEFRDNTLDYALIMKEQVKIYDIPELYQHTFQPETNEFGMIDDEMKNWYLLKCKEIPQDPGQELQADLRWSENNRHYRKKGLTFKVLKTEDGKVWLWNQSGRTGIVIWNLSGDK